MNTKVATYSMTHLQEYTTCHTKEPFYLITLFQKSPQKLIYFGMWTQKLYQVPKLGVLFFSTDFQLLT